MVWFKPKKTLPEDKYQSLLNFYSEMTESKAEILRELISEGKELLALENHSYHVGDYAQIAMMQWRHQDDPRPAIENMHVAYKKLLEYRLKIDPDYNYTMRQFTGTVDWDMVYLLFWFNGHSVSLELYNAVDVEDRYYDYSRHLTCLITDNTPTKDLSEKTLAFATKHSGLLDTNFKDVLKLLGEFETTETHEQIIERLNSNWLKRRNSSLYRNVAPGMAGSDDSNDLSIDFHLAGALKKKSITADTLHQWNWN